MVGACLFLQNYNKSQPRYDVILRNQRAVMTTTKTDFDKAYYKKEKRKKFISNATIIVTRGVSLIKAIIKKKKNEKIHKHNTS